MNQTLLNLRNRKTFPRGARSYKQRLPKDEQQLIERYLEYRSITLNPQKLLDIQRAVLNFRHVLDRPLTGDITLEDVKAFLRVLYRAPVSDETKKSYGEHLFCGRRSLLKWRYPDWSQRFHGFEDESGFKLVRWRVKPLSDRLTENDLLTEEEIRRMWEACERLRDKALIAVHGATPARTKEIRQLRWKDVLFDQHRIRVHDTKTGKSREMPFDQVTGQILRLWHSHYRLQDVTAWNTLKHEGLPPEGDWYVFPGRKDPRQPITSAGAWRTFKRAADRAGITKNVYGYLNRHSVISRYQQKGVDIRDVANVAGHASITTTLGYTHINKTHSIQQVVTKVFAEEQIQEPTPSDKDDQIQLLKRELAEIKTCLREVLKARPADVIPLRDR